MKSVDHYLVHHVDQINTTKLVPVLAKCMVDQAQYGNHEISVHWEMEGIYIEDGDTVVAALCYEHQKFKKQTFIMAAYVEPEYRQRGMYRALWEDLVHRSSKAGMKTIAGGIAPGNKAMIAAAKSVGRKPQYIIYAADVPPLLF